MTKDNLHSWLDEALAPRDLPAGVTSRDLVMKAIEYKLPEMMPLSLVNPVRSDFFELAVHGWHERQQAPGSGIREMYTDEWMVRRKPSAGLFDQAQQHPLENLDSLEAYRYPEFPKNSTVEMQTAVITRAFESEKYIIGNDPVCLYDRVIDLAGLETAMLSPLRDGERFRELLDGLTDLTIRQIHAFGETGMVQGFMTWQDFGMQDRLAMNMDVFRSFYRPCLERMIEAAHSHGMHFIWHCCGAILDLIPDMIEMGVDVLQLDQPRLLGYEKLADKFGGKLCFWAALDTIWSVEKARSENELTEEISKMVNALGHFNGGLMLRHYPQPEDIGLSLDVQDIIAREFLKHSGM